ncbi:hypothetical protein NQZ68_037244 [Dissostichus eleginoides]|nr:hypothetical protein NQZ68_037244 [Dissostichus eleginoides]
MFAVGLQFLFLLTCGVTLGQEHDAVRMVVPEGGDALFPASISRDAEADYFEWKKVGPGGETLDVFKYDAGLHYNNKGLSGQSEQFKGRVSHFHYKLKYGNASIVIGNTTAADSGNYSCSFPRVQPPLNFYLELVVAAAPKPSVTVLTATAGEQESEDSYSRGAMLMVGIFPIVSLAVILAAVVALLLFTKSIKILHKKGSRLKGKYTINMDDGLIIDRSKQSDEGSALKGREEERRATWTTFMI